ncbi:MAG: class B sortase [Coriobacteriaceae bacterium]|nr:class B sortase [Coriobacteriaceae bacterium]
MAQNGTKKVKGTGKLAPALCNVFGVLLLAAVLALCAPVAVPQLFGYQVYNVVSGSMEPEIPVGSAIYVQPTEPAEISPGEVIAFQDSSGVIAHRVTTNRTSMGELVTKGDANEVEDFDPIPYESVIGVVANTVPMLGTFMAIIASTAGKIYLLLTAACGVMLNVLATRMRIDRAARRKAAEIAAANGEAAPADASGADGKSPRKAGSGMWRKVATVVLVAVFVGSGTVVGVALWQYSASDAAYSAASDKYTSANTQSGSIAPKKVDFEKLQKENPDIVGWIYCEDTPIDYPVLQGKDNDQYLHTDYTGAYNIDGSIFVDCDNTPGFIDSNTIIYGHNMNSGAMFACLTNWREQSFYEEHPVVWLLTPTQDYKIVLFAGHDVHVHSSWYDIYKNPSPEFDKFLSDALAESDFKAEVGELPPRGRYVQLSTCAYLFDDGRYALHGLLVSVKSAAGVAK